MWSAIDQWGENKTGHVIIRYDQCVLYCIASCRANISENVEGHVISYWLTRETHWSYNIFYVMNHCHDIGAFVDTVAFIWLFKLSSFAILFGDFLVNKERSKSFERVTDLVSYSIQIVIPLFVGIVVIFLSKCIDTYKWLLISIEHLQ